MDSTGGRETAAAATWVSLWALASPAAKVVLD